MVPVKEADHRYDCMLGDRKHTEVTVVVSSREGRRRTKNTFIRNILLLSFQKNLRQT